MPANRVDCDLLVLGAGAGGLATAVVAARHGLRVVVAEKAPVFGGTMALSGGVLWIPGNRHCPAAAQDTRENARRYLQAETGEFFDAAAVDAFLAHGPEAVDWFERETRLRFLSTLYPDYHPDAPGGVAVGRSILAAPFDIRALGRDMRRLRPPLASITFMGMMFNSSNAELRHFFRATRSLRSFVYVARRLTRHLGELLRHGRSVTVTSGNALAARLAASALDAGVEIWTHAPAQRLQLEAGRVVGAWIVRDGHPVEVRAARGVVLACGGFPHDLERRRAAYAHVRRGGEHMSPTPEDNTGDGIALGEQAGGQFAARFPAPAAWMPVSVLRLGRGTGVFPHLLDRYKPGVIGVTARGLRFCNESNSYHDVGAAMAEVCAGEAETAMWLVCDQAALSRYGLGHVKPAPLPIGRHLRQGYLRRGRTLRALAGACGIDADALERTVAEYNAGAAQGLDLRHGRGTTAFNRYLGDPDHAPNPCVAPIAQAPFYAVKLVMGDLGTFDGLRTDVHGRVLDAAGAPIAGLYAAGNDRASVMGGNYPGAGITLGPHLVFGYLTGLHAARSGAPTAADSHPEEERLSHHAA